MQCLGDDIGNCCGICHYNTVIVMATHKGREKITEQNIEGYSCQKVIVNAHHPDHPLGAKWQYGVNKAKELNPNPLIILGSDDILAKDYIERSLKLLNQGFDFIGCTSWYTLDINTKKVWQMSYIRSNIDFPIGSGKVYSKKALESINYNIFDKKADRRLDDNGHKMMQQIRAKTYLFREPYILAVKTGKEMNSINAYLKSPNIQSNRVDISVLDNFHYKL